MLEGMTFNLAPYGAALPEIFLVLVAITFLMLGVFRGDGWAVPATWLSALALVLTMVLQLQVPFERQVLFYGMFMADGFTVFMKTLVLSGAALALVVSIGYMRSSPAARFEYPVLALFATVGMMSMISAGSLLALYVGLELQSLCLYVMAAVERDNAKSSEAGLKYFVLGALASGMLLFGCSLIYGFTGTVGFEALAEYFSVHQPSIGVTIGMVLVLIGLCFKVSAVPFHMWTPDVYEGAPTPVTAFFALAPKLAALALFVRVLELPFGDLAFQWQQVIIFVAVASMAVGAFGALRQHNIKRLLAYSSIGHVGYALVGLAAGGVEGARAVAIYLAIYLVMSAGAWAAVLLMRRKGKWVEDIADLKGLSATQPLLALAIAIYFFSMAGIPPLAGFFGKMYVFLAAVEKGLVTLAVIGVLASVVSAFYYIRIVKIMYFDEAEKPLDKDIPLEARLVLLGTSLVLTFFFLLPAPLVDWAFAAAETLAGS